MPWRQLDHSADLAFEVEAASREDLLREAVLAFSGSVTDLETVTPRATREVSARGGSLEALLVSLLDELIFVFETARFLARSAELTVMEEPGGGYAAHALLRGEEFVPGRHPLRAVPKAATYHRLRVERAGDAWRAHVVLDL